MFPSSRLTSLVGAIALIASALTLNAQTLLHTHALSDGDPATSDNPFGVTIDPDGVHAYVPLCGDLAPWPLPPAPWAPSWNNNQLLKIEIATGAIVGQVTVGDFPEDVALTVDAGGQTRHLYVSNSSSGTVTCLDAQLNTIATIALSPCNGANYASVYAFGIIAAPDGSKVYANGTSCGTFDVIDSDPSSASFNQITSSFVVPNSYGRPAWLSPTELVVPVTNYVFNPTLGYSDASTTGFTVVDVSNPTAQTTWTLTPFQQFNYPQITGLACTAQGTVLCGVGYGASPVVIEADPVTGSVIRQLDLGIQTGVGLHGLALSPDGSTLALTSLNGGELAFIDVQSFTVASVVATAGPTETPKPNQVAFTPDGSRVVVSKQGMAQLAVYGQLPGFDLGLWATPQVAIGSSGQVVVDHLEAGRYAWVYASDAPGPTTIGPWTIALGPAYWLLAERVADTTGIASATIFVPSTPSLQGATFHLQAVTIGSDSSVRFSPGVSTQIN